METLASWLGTVAVAAFGSAILQLLSPNTKNGLDKYVKFVAATAVLLTVITPLFKILSGLEDYLDDAGIISYRDNINITESNEATKWILSETLDSLDEGVKKLVKERFGVDIQTEFYTGVTSDGIEINSIAISSPVGTPYADTLEAARFLEDYLGIEVKVKNNAE